MLRSCALLICCWITGIAFSQQENAFSGDWKCVDIRCEMMCETCCQYDYYDLQIDDSIRIFRYPFQYFGTSALIQPDWYLSNDTLVHGDEDEDVQFYFLRVKEPFDSEIITVLRRDSINPYEIINKKWSLQTWKEDDIGEDGFDHTIHYPVTLPKKLFFTEPTLNKKLKSSRIVLLVNGKNQWCTIVTLTDYRLTLRTRNQKGELFEFTYLSSE